jgi:hypothetical protein
MTFCNANIANPYIRTTLLACAIAAATSGCRLFEPRYQLPWGKVFDIGDARAITNWGLNQKDWGGVSSAELGLLTLAAETSGQEQKNAVDGFLTLHEKLANGWPGFESSDGQTQEDKAILNYALVSSGAMDQGSNNWIFAGIYARMRPSETNLKLYEAWKKNRPAYDRNGHAIELGSE